MVWVFGDRQKHHDSLIVQHWRFESVLEGFCAVWLPDQRVVVCVEVLFAREVCVVFSKKAVVLFASYQVDILKNFGSVNLREVVVDSIRPYAKLKNPQDGAYNGVLSPVEWNWVHRHRSFKKLELVFLGSVFHLRILSITVISVHDAFNCYCVVQAFIYISCSTFFGTYRRIVDVEVSSGTTSGFWWHICEQYLTMSGISWMLLKLAWHSRILIGIEFLPPNTFWHFFWLVHHWDVFWWHRGIDRVVSGWIFGVRFRRFDLSICSCNLFLHHSWLLVLSDHQLQNRVTELLQILDL